MLRQPVPWRWGAGAEIRSSDGQAIRGSGRGAVEPAGVANPGPHHGAVVGSRAAGRGGEADAARGRGAAERRREKNDCRMDRYGSAQMKASGAVALVLFLAVSTVGVIAFQEQPNSPPGVIYFTDVTKAAGLSFRQSYGDHHLDNIVKGTGTGVCIFDYNNDGYMDIYFPNGKWTKGVNDNEGRDLRGKLSNHLFRNNGDGTFTDVTVQAGLGGNHYSIGCAAADYDNDGFVDLLVLNYGQNELFHNNGDGTFTDVAAKAGLTDARFSLSAVWYDY